MEHCASGQPINAGHTRHPQGNFSILLRNAGCSCGNLDLTRATDHLSAAASSAVTVLSGVGPGMAAHDSLGRGAALVCCAPAAAASCCLPTAVCGVTTGLSAVSNLPSILMLLTPAALLAAIC